MEDQQLLEIADAVRRHGIDGLIATNTTIARPGVETLPVAAEKGGLSGAPLKPRANQVMQTLRASLGADFPLIGVGGILSGEDALARRQAGADLLQIYTGLIYRGPGIVAECAQALAAAR